ncbi:hypothetical protein PENTCL1PPCAC_3289, partial [Pristionchus entomophagus]
AMLLSPYLLLSLSVLLSFCLSSICSPNGFEMTDLAHPKVCIRNATIVDGILKVSGPVDGFIRRADFKARRMQTLSGKIHCLQGGEKLAIFGCSTYDCHETKRIYHSDLVACGMSVTDISKVVWWVFVCVWPVVLGVVLFVIFYVRKVFVRFFKMQKDFNDAVNKAEQAKIMRQRLLEEADRRAALAAAEEAEKVASGDQLPREDNTQEVYS